MATGGCTNQRLVPILFTPRLGKNKNTPFYSLKFLFFHRTLSLLSLSSITCKVLAHSIFSAQCTFNIFSDIV